MQVLEPFENTKRSLLFELVRILEFDAEMRHVSGVRPDVDRDVEVPGQMLEMKYDPQSLTLQNIETLLDIVLHQLRTERETLVDLYPELGKRFDAIKLKYLFYPNQSWDRKHKKELLALKNKYYNRFADLLYEHFS